MNRETPAVNRMRYRTARGRFIIAALFGLVGKGSWADRWLSSSGSAIATGTSEAPTGCAGLPTGIGGIQTPIGQFRVAAPRAADVSSGRLVRLRG